MSFGGFSSGNMPGRREAIESEEAQVWYVGPQAERQAVVKQGAVIKSSVTDSGNTNYTTVIRAGNLLGTKASDGLEYLYNGNGNDGTQFVSGVLPKYQNMLELGVAADKMVTGGILRRGLFHYDALLGYDLHALGVLQREESVIDKDTAGSYGALFLYQSRGVKFVATDTTLTTDDNGCTIRATAAANITLPALAAAMVGFCVKIEQVANANLVVTAAADTIAYDDTTNGKATTLTFSTGNQKMGAGVIMRAQYLDTSGTLGWVPEQIQRTVVAA